MNEWNNEWMTEWMNEWMNERFLLPNSYHNNKSEHNINKNDKIW